VKGDVKHSKRDTNTKIKMRSEESEIYQSEDGVEGPPIEEAGKI
jgi:hypothetical protein